MMVLRDSEAVHLMFVSWLYDPLVVQILPSVVAGTAVVGVVHLSVACDLVVTFFSEGCALQFFVGLQELDRYPCDKTSFATYKFLRAPMCVRKI